MRHSLQAEPRTASRTFRTFADGAIALPAFARTCSGVFWKCRKSTPDLSFKLIMRSYMILSNFLSKTLGFEQDVVWIKVVYHKFVEQSVVIRACFRNIAVCFKHLSRRSTTSLHPTNVITFFVGLDMPRLKTRRSNSLFYLPSPILSSVAHIVLQ